MDVKYRMLFLLFAFGSLLISTSSAQVLNNSDFIFPLRTTRSQVESTLGAGEGECRCIYKTSTEVITVHYAEKECDEGWAVPPDTVIRAETKLVRPSKEAFSLVKGSFVRILDDATYATYIDLSHGLVVHATPYDEVESIERIPTEAQALNPEFRCKDAGQYTPFTRYYSVAFNYKVRGWPNDVAEWNTILFQLKNLREKRLFAFVYFDGTVTKDLQEQYIKKMVARGREVLGAKTDVMIRYGGKRDRSEVEVFLLDRNLPEPSPR